jgi:O-antigen/teichoic acid export membrane protein
MSLILLDDELTVTGRAGNVHRRHRTYTRRVPSRGSPEESEVAAGSAEDTAVVFPAAIEIRGIRAGAIVFAGIVAVNVGNALYHLIAARYLGPADYSEVVSLLALAAIVSIPFTALQVLVARHVAGSIARNEAPAVSAFVRRALFLAGGIGLLVTILLVAATPLIQTGLGIDEASPVILTAAMTVPALLTPVVWGLAQGLQRFGVLVLSMGLGIGLRLALLVVLVVIGLTVNGAVGVTLVGGAIALVVTLLILEPWLRTSADAPRSPSIIHFARSLAPVAIGTLALASLTTADLLVAKAMLADETAGVYGSASLIGRLILFVPATIATVLLPKVSSRAAADRDTRDILHASLAITGAIALAATALVAVAPSLIISLSFGDAFEQAAPLLGLFGVAMSGYALLNVLLTYHLGHESSTMSWLLLGGAVAQVGGYVLFHESGRELLLVSIGIAIALLILHELLILPVIRPTVAWIGEAARVVYASRRKRAAES